MYYREASSYVQTKKHLDKAPRANDIATYAPYGEFARR